MRFNIFFVVLLGIPGVPTSAHHSEAGFDKNTVVAFDAKVIEYDWRNPHVYILVETDGPNGNSVEWRIETSSTPILSRGGWTKDSLNPGDTVIIRGHPERNSSRNYAILLTLEKENGVVLSAASPDPRGVSSASDLSGVWKGSGGQAEEEGEFRQRLSSPLLTEKGASARDSYDFYTDSPVAQCIAHTSPWLITTGLYLNEIDFADDVVIIRSEFFDVERSIFMDGRSHPIDGERFQQGHSIGWWENETLIVDTNLFSDHRTGNGPGIPSGAQKHVIERYTLSEDGRRIILDIVLEDDEYLAEPLSGSIEWIYAPELQLYSYNCAQDVSRAFRHD
jgi:hypothetical protein